MGREHNKVTNQLINVIEKASERADFSETSLLKIVQPNLALVYPNISNTNDPIGFGAKLNTDKLTHDDIFTIYRKGDKYRSLDTLLYFPTNEASFPPGYKLRTYFITYRTEILFKTSQPNQTLGDLNSHVIAAGVRTARIQNLTQPVVIKFKPKTRVYDNHVITCVSWNRYLDGNRGGWSNEGCSYEGRDDDYIICHCR